MLLKCPRVNCMKLKNPMNVMMITRNVIRFRYIIVVNIRFGPMALVPCRNPLYLALVVPLLLKGIRSPVIPRCLIYIRGRPIV